MATETDEEITIKAEIAAGLFMEALEALVFDMARRDRKILDAAASSVMVRLAKFNAARYRPGPHSTMTSQQLHDIRQIGQQEAFDAIATVINRALKKAGKAKQN